jgi:hypothetical protein
MEGGGGAAEAGGAGVEVGGRAMAPTMSCGTAAARDGGKKERTITGAEDSAVLISDTRPAPVGTIATAAAEGAGATTLP